MNKLIKVFLVPFIKLWFVYMALHILVALSITAYGLKSLQGGNSEILVMAFFGFMIISPIYLNSKTNTFVKNISWLINSARNRTQLVIYYHLELTLRIFLTLTPIALYYLLASRNNNTEIYSLDLFSDNQLLMVLGTWAFANFLGLSMSSLKKSNQTRLSRKTSNKKSFIVFVGILFGLYIGGIIVESSIAVEGLLVVLSFLFLVYVYSTHFVLFRKKTRNIIFGIGTLILVFPTYFSISGLIKEVESSNTAFAQYKELGSLVNFIDIKNRDELFNSLETKEDIYHFLEITEDTVNIDIINKIDDKIGYKVNAFIIKSIKPKLSVDEFEILVQRVESLKDNDLDKLISRRFFNRVIAQSKLFKDLPVEDFANTNSKLRQAIALEVVSLKSSAKELIEYKENQVFILSKDQVNSIK